jgi:hypothetical protein
MFSFDIHVYPDTVPSGFQEQHDSQRTLLELLIYSKLLHFIQLKLNGESRCSNHVLETCYPSGESAFLK